MTTGTIVSDSRNTQLSSNSTGSFNTTGGGKYRLKSWFGVDRSKVDRPAATKRTYTTVDQNGHVVRRHFYDRPPQRASDEFHAYQMSLIDYECSRFTMTQDQILYGPLVTSNYTYDAGALTPLLPVWDANDEIKLLSKFSEKIKGSDFNLAVMLGEGHETLKMIGDTAIKLALAGSRIRKGDLAGAAMALARNHVERDIYRRRVTLLESRRALVTGVSGHVLALQWGWKPLLQDIRAGAEMLAHQLEVPFRQKVVVRHRKVNDDWQQCLNNSNPAVVGSMYAIYSKQIIAYLREKPSFAKMTGLVDPELVAWELLPFSMLADYVLPIGDYLSARAFAGSLTGTFVRTTKTLQVWEGLQGRVTRVQGNLKDSTSFSSDANYRYKKLTLDRTITTSLTAPFPVIKSLDKAASWQHCVNSLALMGVIFGSTKLGKPSADFIRTSIGSKIPQSHWNT